MEFKKNMKCQMTSEALGKHEQIFIGNFAVNLGDKVEEFINWYRVNMVKGNYSKLDEISIPNNLKNFIDKMAVWYELKYPDYEITKLFSCSEQVSTQISEESENRVVDWNKLYNIDVFKRILSDKERMFLSEPCYQSPIIIDINGKGYTFILTPDGYVRNENESSEISIDDKEKGCLVFNDIHIEKLLLILKNGNFGLKQPNIQYNEVLIHRYKNECYARDEFLNCVMYEIIERGGNRIGPKRAFLFAKEFDRNIDIPMIYGVNLSDPGLRLFMNEYIKEGGSKDLVCYVDYFLKPDRFKAISLITIQELIETQKNDDLNFYSPEETQLHQRLVTALANKVAANQVGEEMGKKLLLQGKFK